MARTPDKMRVEYDVEVQIKERHTGKVLSTSVARLGVDVGITCYTPAERAARTAVTEARRELGHFT